MRIVGLCLGRVCRPRTPRPGNALTVLGIFALFGVWLRLGWLDLVWVVGVIRSHLAG